MGARTSDIAVPTSPQKDHLYTFYVSFWIGGVWKTTNNGTTFEPVFDAQAKLSIGDVTVAPSNSIIVWVGTGDAFTSRSSYSGDGVYKSTDAGRTWRNMGLRDTQHIARIAIHPTNPERRLRRGDGASVFGQTPTAACSRRPTAARRGTKSLFINDRVGVIDLVMDPNNPAVLYAAAYDKQRLPWQMINGGPGSGDLQDDRRRRELDEAGGGLADRPHRPHRPRHLSEEPGRSSTPSSRTRTRSAGAPPAASRRRTPTMGGEVYRTDNGGQTWTKMNADDYNVSPKGPYYFSQIFVDPNNDQNIFVTQDGFRHSIDGGTTWNAPGDVSAHVRRLPHAVDRSGELGPDDFRQRRRHRDLVRRRPHQRPLREHARRRDLFARRGHGGSVQHLRRPAGSRELEGAVERAARPRDGAGLARRRRRRRHLHAGRSDRQPLALHDAGVRRPHAPRSEARLRDEHLAAARRRRAVPLPVDRRRS